MSVLSFYTRRLSVLRTEERSHIFLQKGHHILPYTRGLLATLSIIGKRPPLLPEGETNLYDKEEDPGPYSLPTQKAFLFFCTDENVLIFSIYTKKGHRPSYAKGLLTTLSIDRQRSSLVSLGRKVSQ